MRRGVFLQLMAAFLLVIAVATVTLDFTIRHAWESSLRQEIQHAMVEKTRLFAQRIASDQTAPLQDLVTQEAAAGNVRATVINSSGKVLADSQADAETMENHATRPEFVAALKGQIGTSERWSHTIGVPFLCLFMVGYFYVPLTGWFGYRFRKVADELPAELFATSPARPPLGRSEGMPSGTGPAAGGTGPAKRTRGGSYTHPNPSIPPVTKAPAHAASADRPAPDPDS